MAKFDVRVTASVVSDLVSGWLSFDYPLSQSDDFCDQRADWAHGAVECVTLIVAGQDLSLEDRLWFAKFLQVMASAISAVEDRVRPSFEISE